MFFFFFQAEDGIRDSSVTGVQTCALPICREVDRCRSTAEHALEELLLLLEIAADRVGHQVLSAEGLGILETDPIDEHQLLWVVDREGAKNDLIDERVKGGGRANSERKGKHCPRRKRRAPKNRARRETQVVQDRKCTR